MSAIRIDSKNMCCFSNMYIAFMYTFYLQQDLSTDIRYPFSKTTLCLLQPATPRTTKRISKISVPEAPTSPASDKHTSYLQRFCRWLILILDNQNQWIQCPRFFVDFELLLVCTKMGNICGKKQPGILRKVQSDLR